MEGNWLQEFLFCPSHGLLRWWPLVVPALAGGMVYVRQLCRKIGRQR